MSSFSGTQSVISDTELNGAHELIEAFVNADRELLVQIHNGNDDAISDIGDRVDRLLSALLEFQSGEISEMKRVVTFLMDRFVVSENSSPELRQRIVTKTLALL